MIGKMGAEIEALHDRSSDPYIYPATDVLRNLRDIRSFEILVASRPMRQRDALPS